MVVVLLACELGITQPAKLFEEKTNTDLIMPGTNEAVQPWHPPWHWRGPSWCGLSVQCLVACFKREPEGNTGRRTEKRIRKQGPVCRFYQKFFSRGGVGKTW